MARVTLPKVPSAMKPPSPSAIAPGGKGPKRVKAEKSQPGYDEFNVSAYKRARPRASLPEYLVWWVMVTKLNMKPGTDFVEQYDLGQEIVGGIGAIVDFVIVNRFPLLAIPVQGSWFHPTHGEKFIYDLAQFSRIVTRKGWNLVPLQEKHLIKNAQFYVKEALRGNDLSDYRGKY